MILLNKLEMTVVIVIGRWLYMFIYCFDSETKEQLIKKGYKFLCKNKKSDKTIYVFENNKKENFSKSDKVFTTSKLCF